MGAHSQSARSKFLFLNVYCTLQKSLRFGGFFAMCCQSILTLMNIF